MIVALLTVGIIVALGVGGGLRRHETQSSPRLRAETTWEDCEDASRPAAPPAHAGGRCYSTCTGSN